MGTLGLAVRMVGSLAVVLGLLFVLARFTRRGKGGGGGPAMNVMGRVALGGKASVTVVRLADRALVLGVTEQAVTLLTETDLSVLETAGSRAEVRTPIATDLLDEVSLRHVESMSTPAAPATHRADGAVRRAETGALSGSALSPATWKRTVNAVRDLTVRQ